MIENKYETSLCDSCRYQHMDFGERPCHDCACECTVPDEEDLANCRLYVEAMLPAVSGHNGHAQTRKAAEVIFHGFALNEDHGWPILLEYNCRCAPPWPVKELRRFMVDAFRKPPTDRRRGALREQYRGEDGEDASLSPILSQVTMLNDLVAKMFICTAKIGLDFVPVRRIVTDGKFLFVLDGDGKAYNLTGGELYDATGKIFFSNETGPKTNAVPCGKKQ